MVTQWTGKLYVISQSNERFDVCLTLPPGAIDSSKVCVYEATGPRPPISVPGTITVEDFNAWMEEQKQAGFSFTSSL